MGIPGLFSNILKKYKETIDWKNISTDYYFMDFNSFMHLVISKYISENMEELKKISQVKIETKIIKFLIEKTEEIVTQIVKPQKILYIAIDGSVPLAKMTQQRSRRYKGIIMNEYIQQLREKYKIEKGKPIVNNEVWDSVNISPGTIFMKKVSDSFKKVIKTGIFCKHLTNISNFKIFFSDTNTPGEGEHKIMIYIRSLIKSNILNPTDKITIYSEDADLIVLSFPYKYDIRIQRPIKKQDRKNYPKELPDNVEYIYFLVDKFKNALIKEVDWGNLNINRIVYDYIFLSLMGGNDFVKHLSYLRVNVMLFGKDGLSNIINYYNNIKIYNNNKNQYVINVDFSVNTNLFKKLINEMAKHEDKAMKILYNKLINMKPRNKEEQHKNPWNLDISKFEHDSYLSRTNPSHNKYREFFNKINYNLSYDQWTKQYYNHFFEFDNDKDIGNICFMYIKSLLFSFYYYLYGIPPTWRWTYPYRVAPLLSDLKNYIKKINDINILNKWEETEPFLPLEQLFMIISPKNVNILPKSYQNAMLNPPLNIYYPDTFILDVLAGGKYIYSEPILSEIQDDSIIEELKKIKLTKTDLSRNKYIEEPDIYGCL